MLNLEIESHFVAMSKTYVTDAEVNPIKDLKSLLILN